MPDVTVVGRYDDDYYLTEKGELLICVEPVIVDASNYNVDMWESICYEENNK